MRTICVAAFVVGLIAYAQCMSEEEMAMIKKMSEACVERTGVAKELVMKAKDGDFATDATFKEYLFCMVSTPGFINEAGDYQIDVMQGMFEKNCGPAKAKEIIDDCTKFEGDRLEKAFQLAKCMYLKKGE